MDRFLTASPGYKANGAASFLRRPGHFCELEVIARLLTAPSIHATGPSGPRGGGRKDLTGMSDATAEYVVSQVMRYIRITCLSPSPLVRDKQNCSWLRLWVFLLF